MPAAPRSTRPRSWSPSPRARAHTLGNRRTRWGSRRVSRVAIAAAISLICVALLYTFSFHSQESAEGLKPQVTDWLPGSLSSLKDEWIQEVEKSHEQQHAPELVRPKPEPQPLPPLYERFHTYELELPQHDPSLPYPEGRLGRYFYPANHVHGSGWGNVMQEHLMNAYLAYRSGRALVFDNYTWEDDGSDYSEAFDGSLIPSRIPLSAFLRGPAVGDPFPQGEQSPRAVIKEYFDEVCPHPQIISSEELVPLGDPSSATERTRRWVDKLSHSDRCVAVRKSSYQIFDIWIFGEVDRLLDIWPSFSQSPIMTQLQWSALVELAFDTNRQLLLPSSTVEPALISLPFTTAAQRYTQLPGLLVLHLRRGDFEEHCVKLSEWGSGFTGWNSFPGLPDPWAYPPEGASADEARRWYVRRCYPEIGEIMRRAAEAKQSPAGRGLRAVYIMTNGEEKWVRELENSLREHGGWESVASTKDLVLNHEQQYVAQAVDMLIGQRAQVLIGNGFSSLTGMIVMLRMANGIPLDSNRFW
ncbi:hypothetical protein CERSUDRAFT_118643 [Gelatoporia subvermispora B]|uniref:Uncharacterized protein n=1 Tax=Ceriporiopsis subvermispora (strain B) TaxID=914234 RepID=M2QKE4_CERS8|nr:hypothetical protein CERSUDRAFT_118643 [Gelatoporia subvermispora B]